MARGKQNNKKSKRSGRGRSGQGITVTRTVVLGSLPAGNSGFQFTASLSVYPDFGTLLPIARCYSEYKFVRFQVTLTPRCSVTTMGTKWLGFGYSIPFTPADYTSASSLAGFSDSPAYGRVSRSSLSSQNAAQRWYPVYQDDLSAAQLADPNIVQAYLYAGTNGVQSGVVAADIKVSYTVMFRGPVANVNAIGPASTPVVVSRFTHLYVEDEHNEDGFEE